MSNTFSQYGMSRNIKKSTLEFIQDVFIQGDRSDVNVMYESARDSESELPNITIQLSTQRDNSIECGSRSSLRNVLLIVDIRAKTEGDKLDLTDLLKSKMKHGWPYNKYEITNGKITSSHRKGRIEVKSEDNSPVDLGVEKSRLTLSDRFRQRLTFKVATNIIEE